MLTIKKAALEDCTIMGKLLKKALMKHLTVSEKLWKKEENTNKMAQAVFNPIHKKKEKLWIIINIGLFPS